MEKNNKTTTKRRSRSSRTSIHNKRARDNWDEDEEYMTSDYNMSGSDDSDDSTFNITKEFQDLAAVMQNVPPGVAIDLCPSGSIREKRVNKLADDIQFVNQLESSDSDVSLDLDELDDPRKIQCATRMEKFSSLRRKLEGTQVLVENTSSKTWTEKLTTCSEKFTNKYNETENRTMPIRQDLQDLGKEKVNSDTKCSITPWVQLGVKISEKLCTTEKKKFTRIKEDPFSNFSFHLINGTPFNTASKLSKEKFQF